MLRPSHQDSSLSLNPVALSSYAVAICAFAGSAVGLVVHEFPSGALAAVGGFYLVVGLLSRSPKQSALRDDSSHTTSNETSGVDNLIAEAANGAVGSNATSARNRNVAVLSK